MNRTACCDFYEALPRDAELLINATMYCIKMYLSRGVFVMQIVCEMHLFGGGVKVCRSH